MADAESWCPAHLLMTDTGTPAFSIRLNVEFPTTLDAARAARDRGMLVVAGAPNVLRGASHSGNVAAAELIGHGLVDGLSSDYMPFTMVGAAFRLAGAGTTPLPTAVRMVTSGSARVAGLTDRGWLVPGARADLALVTVDAGWPTVRATWSAQDSRDREPLRSPAIA